MFINLGISKPVFHYLFEYFRTQFSSMEPKFTYLISYFHYLSIEFYLYNHAIILCRTDNSENIWEVRGKSINFPIWKRNCLNLWLLMMMKSKVLFQFISDKSGSSQKLGKKILRKGRRPLEGPSVEKDYPFVEKN